MADHAIAHAKTAAHEADYANHPKDRGGETWRGIARKFWPHWPGWGKVDAAKKVLGLPESVLQVSPKARKMLSQHLAADAELQQMVLVFFKHEFWDVLHLDEQPRQTIAENIYDEAVNAGEKPTRAMVERALAAMV